MKWMKSCVYEQELSCAENKTPVSNATSPYASRPEDTVEALPVKMKSVHITELDKTLLMALNLLGVATPHQLALLLEKAGLLTDADAEELIWQRCEQMGTAQYMQAYGREDEKEASARGFAVTMGWRGRNALKLMGVPGLYKEQLCVLARQHKATAFKKALAANALLLELLEEDDTLERWPIFETANEAYPAGFVADAQIEHDGKLCAIVEAVRFGCDEEELGTKLREIAAALQQKAPSRSIAPDCKLILLAEDAAHMERLMIELRPMLTELPITVAFTNDAAVAASDQTLYILRQEEEKRSAARKEPKQRGSMARITQRILQRLLSAPAVG